MMVSSPSATSSCKPAGKVERADSTADSSARASSKENCPETGLDGKGYDAGNSRERQSRGFWGDDRTAR